MSPLSTKLKCPLSVLEEYWDVISMSHQEVDRLKKYNKSTIAASLKKKQPDNSSLLFAKLKG